MRTCQVGVVRRVDEVVRQGEAHIFRLVQLLWRDNSILIAGQIAGEALKGNNTCTQNSTSVLLHHIRKPDFKVLALLLEYFVYIYFSCLTVPSALRSLVYQSLETSHSYFLLSHLKCD